MNFRKFFPVIFIFVLLALFSLGYIYFFKISPQYQEKPQIEKPTDTREIKLTHVIFILNEMGAYKLHSHTLSGEPAELKFIISDLEKEYDLKVEQGEIYKVEETDPDIKIISDEETLLEIIHSEDTLGSVMDNIDQNKIQFDFLKDETVLAFKGYKSIYDNLQKESSITGNVVNLRAYNVTNGLGMSTLLSITVLIGMILRLET